MPKEIPELDSADIDIETINSFVDPGFVALIAGGEPGDFVAVFGRLGDEGPILEFELISLNVET